MLMRKMALGSVLCLVLCASSAFASGEWSTWRSAGGQIEYKWRSSLPCTAAGCPLVVVFRNTESTPVKFHYSIYVDQKDEPSMGDSYLAPNSAGIEENAGDGSQITRVKIEVKR